MGAWGTSLYSNDTTCDVRDTYMDFLKDQMSNEETFDKTLNKFNELIGDKDEEPLFWFALAETQWKVGRLTSDVKEKALMWIEKDGGVALWEESGTSGSGWKKTLQELKDKLESPMRSEKKIQAPKAVNKSLWNVGDVYAYQLHKEVSKTHGTYGKYVLIQKIGEGSHIPQWMTSKDAALQPILARIHIYDKTFDQKPSLQDIDHARLLPIGLKNKNDELPMDRLINYDKKKNYPEQHLFYLGNTTAPFSKIIDPEGVHILWTGIENVFNKYYKRWQGKEYEVNEEGIFYPKT